MIPTHPVAALRLSAVALFFLSGAGSEAQAQNSKKPSRHLIDQYDSCLSRQALSLDDMISEAKTIAEAINTACRDSLRAMNEDTVPKSSGAPLVTIYHMKTLVPVYEEKVLPMVLQRRTAMRGR
jgi:hypothetical protein